MKEISRFKKMHVILILIGINTLVYLYSCYLSGSFNPRNLVLYRLGAYYKVAIMHGEIYRLITSMFLHAGPMHIAFNMYALYVLGQTLSNLLDWKKLLGLYMVTGIAANLFNMVFDSDSLGVGASGAIFGLIGFLLLVFYKARKNIGSKPFYNILVIIALNFVIAFTPGLNIGYINHLGGLIAGAILGLIFTKKYRITTSY